MSFPNNARRQNKIGVFTTICEPDNIWIDQYLNEIERLELPFAIYLDRCSGSTIQRLTSHTNCIGFVRQDNPLIDYQECHKKAVLDLIVAHGRFDWAMSWDADETYEKDASYKLPDIVGRTEDCLNVRWACLWNDPQHIRTDGMFSPNGSCYYRDRFHSLRGENKWYYKGPFIYGPYNAKGEYTTAKIDFVCLHWGYMSRPLRELHKARWDHNYGTAVGGKNPFGTWEYILDEVTYPPEVETHNWL